MHKAFNNLAPDQFDKLPPHSIEAEMSLLASMMLDEQLRGEALGQVDADSFYLQDHRIICDAMRALHLEGKPVDALILKNELDKQGVLEDIGGAAYLGEILNTVPSAANGTHYLGIVREKAILRALIAASNKSIAEAYAPHDSAEQLVDRAARDILSLAEKRMTNPIVTLGTVAEEVYEMLEDRTKRGVSTGYRDLDDMLNGLQAGEMIIIAARPSMGKTAFAMNLVEMVAQEKQSCAVFSLEMSRQQLAQRMMCSLADVDSHRVRKGMLSTSEYHDLARVVRLMAQMPVWVSDTPGLTLLDFRTQARRLKHDHDIKLIMIDYMQLMENPGPESRQQQISEISRGIKAVARELEVPVIALSQLNRLSEQRDGHRPRMSDLRESGSIEQDADVVMLLHREDYFRQQEPDYEPDNIAEVIIAKQRNGPTGTVKLFFDNKSTRFKPLETRHIDFV